MASVTPYKAVGEENPVKALDYTKDALAGANTAKTYHGLCILVDGKTIGRIQTWGPGARTRQVTLKWELSRFTFGRPVELVPSKADGYTISIGRIEVWQNELELALGYDARWSDLIDQNYPITLTESLYKGTSLQYSWSYPACWFNSYSEEQITSEGDGYYQVTAEVTHLPRYQTV